MNRTLLKSITRYEIILRRISLKSHLSTTDDISSIKEVATDDDTAELQEILDPNDIVYSEKQIEKMRNKSYLNPYHLAEMNNKCPDISEVERKLMSPKELRELFGKYGQASMVPHHLLWPSTEELKNAKEFEGLNNEFGAHEALEKQLKLEKEEADALQKEQEDISENMKMIAKYRNLWYKKTNEKLVITKQKLARKKELISQVRSTLGPAVNVENKKFQEELLRLEKLDARTKKAEKKAKSNKSMTEQ